MDVAQPPRHFPKASQEALVGQLLQVPASFHGTI